MCVGAVAATESCVCTQLEQEEHSWTQLGTQRGYVTSMATVVSARPFKPRRSGSWFSLRGEKSSQSGMISSHSEHISSHSFSHFFHVFTQLSPGPGRNLNTHTQLLPEPYTHTPQTLFGSKYWHSTTAVIQQCSPFCKILHFIVHFWPKWWIEFPKALLKERSQEMVTQHW